MSSNRKNIKLCANSGVLRSKIEMFITYKYRTHLGRRNTFPKHFFSILNFM